MGIVKLLFKKNYIEKNVDSVKIEIKQEVNKILFQPNTILSKETLEFPLNKENNKKEDPKEEKTPFAHKIVIECNESALSHLQNLCRFFEIEQLEAISRGIWLLTIARDAELNNKKIGLISLDNNGMIIDVMPMNLV